MKVNSQHRVYLIKSILSVVGEPVLCEWRSQSLDLSPDLRGDLCSDKDSRKERASIKQLIKAEIHFQGERGSSFL